MVAFSYGGKNGKQHSLEISTEHLVVRSDPRLPIAPARPYEASPVSPAAQRVLEHFELAVQFREAGVEVLQARTPRDSEALRDEARSVLKQEPSIEFAGRVLIDAQAKRPVVYTENIFVKFSPQVKHKDWSAALTRYGLKLKRPLEYARNACFVQAPEGTGLDVFDIANKLLQEDIVELCHPELVREVRQRAAFAPQWHLKRTTVRGQIINAHAHVEAAWSLSDGTGTIIAVIDDGVDLGHEEFQFSGKIVAPRDVTRGTDNPRPGNGDNHGTACAGVACGSGKFGASGVAPGARLLPIRLASGLGSQAEADAFVWAAQHGADVISCSWGPRDGRWFDPNDPVHNQVVPLPDSTRLAIDFAANQGRNGKGCVILFAAGNGNESVDNDGYASHANVIAVGASNDMGTRSAYSDFGQAVWCAFPSSHGEPSKTPGIWTTDRSGPVGYNEGNAIKGDAAGHYTNSFGGTSSACPGAAGVAALILARNPNLRRDEVREIIRQSCDRIDAAHGNYDANGHSPLYGYGRINARKALDLAVPAQTTPLVTRSIAQDVLIRDMKTAKLTLPIADTAHLKSIKVSVDIEHTYVGDLVVRLKPPAALKLAPIVLHSREGGAEDNLKKSYDTVNAPGLSALIGKSPAGKWTLEVADKEAQDTGKVRSFTLEMAL